MTNEPEPNTRAGEALKPCERCGGKPMLCEPNYADEGGTMVVCEDCDLAGDSFVLGEYGEGRAQAITAWNTRPLPQPSELVETPEAFNKKKERCLAYVEQHWKWGNLTRLGIVNQLVRDGFRQTWAIEQADRIAPAANQAVAHITQLEAQIAKLQARLEVVPGWSEDADGIACRNDTIKLQDECIAKLQADGDKLAGAATALRDDMLMRAEMRKRRNNGELVVEAGNGVWHRINEALTEWGDRA
mgnify:CR=1 FL=1